MDLYIKKYYKYKKKYLDLKNLIGNGPYKKIEDKSEKKENILQNKENILLNIENIENKENILQNKENILQNKENILQNKENIENKENILQNNNVEVSNINNIINNSYIKVLNKLNGKSLKIINSKWLRDNNITYDNLYYFIYKIISKQINIINNKNNNSTIKKKILSIESIGQKLIDNDEIDEKIINIYLHNKEKINDELSNNKQITLTEYIEKVNKINEEKEIMIKNKRLIQKNSLNYLFTKINIIDNVNTNFFKDYYFKDNLSLILDEIIEIQYKKQISDKEQKIENLISVFRNTENEIKLENINGILNIDYENIYNLYFETKRDFNNFIKLMIKLINKKFIINLICKNKESVINVLLNYYSINNLEELNYVLNNNLLNIYAFSFESDPYYRDTNPYDDAIFNIINLSYFIKLQKIEQINKLFILSNDNQRIENNKYIFDFKIEKFNIKLEKFICNNYSVNNISNFRNKYYFSDKVNNKNYYSNYQLNKLFKEIVTNSEFYNNNIIPINDLILKNMSNVLNPNIEELMNNKFIIDKIKNINHAYIFFNDEQYNNNFNYLINKNIIDKNIIDKYKIGLKFLSYFKYMQLIYFSILYKNNIWSFCNKNYNNNNVINENSNCTNNSTCENIERYFSEL